MRHLFFAALAAVAFTSAPAKAQNLAEFMKTVTAAWNKPTDPFTMISNVHYVGTNGLAKQKAEAGK